MIIDNTDNRTDNSLWMMEKAFYNKSNSHYLSFVWVIHSCGCFIVFYFDLGDFTRKGDFKQYNI